MDHAVVNEKGRLIRAVFTGGQVHDCQAIPSPLDSGLNALLAIMADKAYGSKVIRQQIADEGALAVIRSKSNARIPTPHDPNHSAMRNVVERFFYKMKDMRRLDTRFKKLSQKFLAMLHLFAIRQWCN